jgi:hypothetical protein
MIKKHRDIKMLFIVCLCVLVVGCVDAKKDSSTSKGTEVSPVSTQKNNLLPTRLFPIGRFTAKEVILEVRDGRTFRASEMDLFDFVSNISLAGENRIKIEIFAKLRMTSKHQTKQDNRLDYYRVQWSDDSHGKLVSEDQSQQVVDFTIDNGMLTLKAWVSRNNAWETQIYNIGKRDNSKKDGTKLYRLLSAGWQRNTTPTGEVFTCSVCESQVQVQVDIGPPLGPDAKIKTNEQLISQLKDSKQQTKFADNMLTSQIPLKEGYSVKIERTGFTKIGGQDAFQFTAVVDMKTSVIHDTTMILIYKGRFVKITINHHDGTLNANVREAINSLLSSVEFL